MFWIIGCGLIGVVIAISETTKYIASGWYLGFWVAALICVLTVILGAVIGGLIGFFIAWLCSFFVKYENDNSEFITLAPLERDSNFNGGYFLGTGTIDSEPYYYFYEVSDDNKSKLQRVSAKDATIREFEEECEELEVEAEVQITKEVPIGNDFVIDWLTCTYDRNFKYEFVIPKGSIKHDFAP
jgi:hypothetical protein